VSTPRIRTDNLSVHFGDRSALDTINVSFVAGQTTSILGPNGAGKSTLLKTIAGMLHATHGRVLLDGEAVTGPCSRVVYVPQRSSVDWTFPISVLDVALMGVGLRRSRFTPLAAADRDAALAALDAVNMNRLAKVQIGQLSGGQQQRVFLARALLQQGDVYLLDEPFTGVDVPTQGLLVELFANLARQGKTIIYATHDLALAAATSDRVLLLNRRVIADGPPGTTMTADNLRATFGGQAVVPPAGAVA
jgi:ABC-type Mn2+/Zn2+ transport system ATPase subunit